MYFHIQFKIGLNIVLLAVPEKEGIQDETGTNLVNLRRTIYLTIMNSVGSFDELLMKLSAKKIIPMTSTYSSISRKPCTN